MAMIPQFLNSSYARSFLIAAGLHVGLLFGGGWALSQKAEFGMEVGQSSVEVDLMAAPPEEQPPPVQAKNEAQPQTDPVIAPLEPDDFVLPEIPEEKPKLVVKMVEPSHHKNDASLPDSGEAKTTLRSSRGAITEVKPNYLKNPPPAYPEVARKRGEEGLVLLSVLVDADGDPREVKIKRSPGFSLLDEAAKRSVSRWKFRPANVGGINVISEVEVPIRFQLN